MRLRISAALFCLVLAACGGKQEAAGPAGKTLVLYWGGDGSVKAIARAIARYPGVSLHNMAAQKKAPDIEQYDNFFIGFSSDSDGALPEMVSIKEIDFAGRYVAVFCCGAGEADALSRLIRGACITGAKQFPRRGLFARGALKKAARAWAAEELAEMSPPQPAAEQYEGVGLVLYWGPSFPSRRAARSLAALSGAEMFDLSSEAAFPRPLDYDNFFISLPEPVPDGARAFLDDMDFYDGNAVLLWTSQDSADPASRFISPLVHGARIAAEHGVPQVNALPPAALHSSLGQWLKPLLGGLSARQKAGLRAEYVVKAYAFAYPDRITEAAFRDGDWAFLMDGVWYYYAESRILPEDERGNFEAYRPQQYYRYWLEDEAPAWQNLKSGSADWRASINRRFQFSNSWRGGFSTRGLPLYPFFEKLVQIHSRAEAQSRLRPITIFGRKLDVHYQLVTPLARVQEQILALSKTDRAVQDWLDSITNITCWNWRNIAGTERRSYHAYAYAVDLEMRPRAGYETYWQWTQAKGIDFRSVPRDKLLQPPSVVVRVFEDNGFIWGGKWPMYDTMHFEYRPEILLLSY
jgi:flavodoxin